MKTIYLGGGCFWCTEAVFKSLRGVQEVIPGYMGGTVPNPSYEAVCSGTTGHIEVIKVYYDETVISTDDILDIFFATHDPTTPNRQGNDVGSQYRSVIFYTQDQEPHSREGEVGGDIQGSIQRSIGRAQAGLSGDAQIVTEVVTATEFYPAEEYHHNYYAQHSDVPYCQIVISPKLEKLQKKFSDKLL
ncbi:MAG TPA: peptide-methionine (S)-S-oxide reductase MsrA [Candidatus Paceibacterota bacterium]